MMEHGLTEYQARVYLTLLDLGAATASQIPTLSRVPRTRIYATMQQLHEKGLVQILPETPMRYKAVPFAVYLKALAQDLRARASQLEGNLEALSREFAIRADSKPETHGRFEAIYGRRNVRERLLGMYEPAEREIIGIGTSKSPGRVWRAFGPILAEKAAQGVSLRYAFHLDPENVEDVQMLMRHAKVRRIDFPSPVYLHSVDRREFLMSHPIPDDESVYRGDDIAIWTNDRAIAEAMAQMAERIWEAGKPAAPARA